MVLEKYLDMKTLFASYKEMRKAELRGAGDDCFNKRPEVTDMLGTEIYWLSSFFSTSLLQVFCSACFSVDRKYTFFFFLVPLNIYIYIFTAERSKTDSCENT